MTKVRLKTKPWAALATEAERERKALERRVRARP